MKGSTIWIILVIVMGMIACSKPSEAPGDKAAATGPDKDSLATALEIENKALVNKYIHASLTGDVKGIEELIGDNFKDYGPYRGDTTSRASFLAKMKKDWEERYASMKYTRMISLAHTEYSGRLKGDWILEWGTLSVTYKNGTKPISIKYHAALKIKDGKVVYVSSYWNGADAMKQQGFTFVEPANRKVVSND